MCVYANLLQSLENFSFIYNLLQCWLQEQLDPGAPAMALEPDSSSPPSSATPCTGFFLGFHGRAVGTPSFPPRNGKMVQPPQVAIIAVLLWLKSLIFSPVTSGNSNMHSDWTAQTVRQP